MNVLRHTGPAMPSFSIKKNEQSEYQGMLILPNNNTIHLSPLHTYIVSMYFERYRLKVDEVFKRNFWKSLNVFDPRRVNTDTITFRKPKRLLSIMYTPGGAVYLNERAVDVVGRVDGPSIFCGRDPHHPKRGTCKWGVKPSEVTLNLSPDAILPAKKKGFVRFVHQPHVRWIASWKDPVSDERRYVTIKQPETISKFDQARVLKKKLPKIHTLINESIQQTTNHKLQQLALAVYLIEHLCIRVGNEKDTMSEADTVGCCTLRAHTHVRIQNGATRTVRVSFSGKDSIPFDKSIALPPRFFDVLAQMLRTKPTDALLFDLINPTMINRYIQKVCPSCTAKTFRTMRASATFERVLRNTNDPVRANGDVARLLNHQRATKSNRTRMYNMQTSRNNYIDPRIYYAFCNQKKETHKTLFSFAKQEAMHTDPNFTF